MSLPLPVRSGGVAPSICPRDPPLRVAQLTRPRESEILIYINLFHVFKTTSQ